MNENMVEISKNEYKQIMKLAYKAAMLKEAVLNSAALDLYGENLYFGVGNEVATVFKYAFPSEYESKLRELIDKKKAEDGKEGADDEH